MRHTTTPTRLTGEVLRIENVRDEDREQMYALMKRYYENVRRDTFESDFASKTWVIAARCPASGDVQGFSTQWFGNYVINGSTFAVLYSGDTIIEKQYWARNPLATLWGRLALELIDRFPQSQLVWFLISKGYKTYRFLPVFFREFYPSPDAPFAPHYQRLIRQVAHDKFPDRYASSRGVIEARPGDSRLRDSVADVTQERLRDRFVKFFDTVNSGHTDGDELCCIAPLTRENFNEAAYRIIGMHVDTPGSSRVASP